jgi:hypothetical protein
MKRTSLLYAGVALGCGLAAVLLIGQGSFLQPAFAQPAPMPQECVCSAGVTLGESRPPVVIRHCQCGILNCAVVVPSGQLQCVR